MNKYYIFRDGVYIGSLISRDILYAINFVNTGLSIYYDCHPSEFVIVEAYN